MSMSENEQISLFFILSFFLSVFTGFFFSVALTNNFIEFIFFSNDNYAEFAYIFIDLVYSRLFTVD